MKWLIDLFKPKPYVPQLVHPIFGGMDSFKSPDGITVWQSRDDCETPVGQIAMTIDGTDDGPDEELVKSWQEITANFDFWKAKAEPKLRERLQEFGHSDKFDELKISGFGMYTVGREPIDWDVSFDLESEYFLYTVCFKDGEPTIVHADS